MTGLFLGLVPLIVASWLSLFLAAMTVGVAKILRSRFR